MNAPVYADKATIAQKAAELSREMQKNPKINDPQLSYTVALGLMKSIAGNTRYFKDIESHHSINATLGFDSLDFVAMMRETEENVPGLSLENDLIDYSYTDPTVLQTGTMIYQEHKRQSN